MLKYNKHFLKHSPELMLAVEYFLSYSIPFVLLLGRSKVFFPTESTLHSFRIGYNPVAATELGIVHCEAIWDAI